MALSLKVRLCLYKLETEREPERTTTHQVTAIQSSSDDRPQYLQLGLVACLLQSIAQVLDREVGCWVVGILCNEGVG